MNLKNCKRCGKMFSYAFGPMVCPSCLGEEEELFQRAKKYVQDHPGCDMKELSAEIEVDAKQIREWIREERLQFADDSCITIQCEKCGASIRSGRFCDKCKSEMSNGLQDAFGMNKPKLKPEPKRRESDGNKMRFL